MVIYLASYPRSGNTFLRLLLNRALGLKTCGVDLLFDQLGIADMIGHQPFPDTIENLNSRPELYFVKTHDLPSDNLPAIYIVRDGRDTVVSFARYTCSFPNRSWRSRRFAIAQFFNDPASHLAALSELDPFKRSLKKIITGSLFGGWSKNVLGWTRNRQGPTTVIRFEDLISDPLNALQKVLLSLPLEIGEYRPPAIPTFEELHKLAPEFFRKGRVGSWRSEFTPRLYELFWSIHGDAMDFHAYRRDSALPHSQAE